MTRGFITDRGNITLVPFIDLINSYCPEKYTPPQGFTSMLWDFNNKVVSAHSSIGGRTGQEIFSCYVMNQQPRTALLQHGYTPERNKDQTVGLDNLALSETDPLKTQKVELITYLLQDREPLDVCVIENGIPIDTTLAVAYIIKETDPFYLEKQNFYQLFEPTPGGSIPLLDKSDIALKYIVRCLKDKLEEMDALHKRKNLDLLVADKNIPYHVRQVYKLFMNEYDIVNKLYLTNYKNWAFFPTLKKFKKQRSQTIQ